MSNDKHNHEEGFECEACKNGMEALLEKEQRLLKEPGWFVHFVPGSEGFPYETNVHTHGLKENFDHLDLQVCLPMNPHVTHDILTNVIEDNIKKGTKYEAGKKYNDIIEPSPAFKDMKFQILFLKAEENGREVLRLIFPEKDGSFIGEMSTKQMEGCEIPSDLILSYEK